MMGQYGGGKIVELNVGGVPYCTSSDTLRKIENSFLGAMFHERNRCFDPVTDKDGRVFIDRDGKLFRHVLNFLRDGCLALDEDFRHGEALLVEAKFFALDEMIEQLEAFLAQKQDNLEKKWAFLLKRTGYQIEKNHHKRKPRTISLESEATHFTNISSSTRGGILEEEEDSDIYEEEEEEEDSSPITFDQNLFSVEPDF